MVDAGSPVLSVSQRLILMESADSCLRIAEQLEARQASQ